jgi:acyl-CoA synthetase (AMP-forming)/AMP-acid ligase II
MFHIGGVLVGVGFLALGGSTVFPSASFDPVASFAAIEQERCTNLPCVPAMLQMLAAHPQLAKTDLSSIRNVEMGATTILPEHLSLVRKAIKCKTMTNGYAATEGLPLTMGRFDTSRSTINVGTVTPGVRLRISDPDTGVLMERGVAGEIHFGGPTLIRGYLGNASSDSFYRDECGVWFKSGDQGIMAEDGTVSVVGRYKDLIIRGGENIAPAAIEAVMDAKLGISVSVFNYCKQQIRLTL